MNIRHVLEHLEKVVTRRDRIKSFPPKDPAGDGQSRSAGVPACGLRGRPARFLCGSGGETQLEPASEDACATLSLALPPGQNPLPIGYRPLPVGYFPSLAP